jgi:hypothetical protein
MTPLIKPLTSMYNYDFEIIKASKSKFAVCLYG